MRILIVDDHQMFREGFESLLKNKLTQRSKIRHVASCDEAIAQLSKEPFDIIFMDILMPEKNGIDSTKEILKLFPKVKIIALTMLEDRKSIATMFNAGAVGYILKNTSFKEIEEAIGKVMAGEKYYNKTVSDILFQRILKPTRPLKRGPFMVDLSAREKEIIVLICQAFSNKEISDILCISEKTIEAHRARIYTKLDIGNVIDLVYYALDTGIVVRNE